jgi:succinate dehydrogenase / fumarate reductase cytochrome b subunit
MEPPALRIIGPFGRPTAAAPRRKGLTRMAAAPSLTVGGYLQAALRSSLGAKLVMAVTGLIFYVWLILHLLGNLSVFAGAETMNAYAHFLQSKPELLWASRIGLLGVVLAHVFTGISLSTKNKAARPTAYQSPRNWRQASLASRTMLVSGLVALTFLLVHLLHFTGGVLQPDSFAKTHTTLVDGEQVADVYAMVKAAFETPGYALFYVFSVGMIGFHLSHAVWSATHTLGFTGPRWTPFAKKLGWALGVGVAALFCLIPIAGLAGFLG